MKAADFDCHGAIIWQNAREPIVLGILLRSSVSVPLTVAFILDRRGLAGYIREWKAPMSPRPPEYLT